MKKFFNLLLITSGVLWISIHEALAQCPDGCEGTFPNCAPCFDTSTPIDETTGILLLAGIGLGIKRLLKKKPTL